jgi:transcription-repair coupling factor (superfamily II helicase)
LENLLEGFKDLSKEVDLSTLNLFKLIRLKILASNYKISSIRKLGVNYQIDFEPNTPLEEIKKFLILDREVRFSVVNARKLRALTKNFKSEEKFLEYLLYIFTSPKAEVRKVKLRK